MEVGKSQNLQSELQSGDPGEPKVSFHSGSKRREKADVPVWRPWGRKNSLLLGGESAFLSLQAFNWLRATYVIQGSLL